MSEALRQPQQERSHATLARIEQAAFALLASGGWDAVTVNGIGRLVGVSRGAFYSRFPSREALLDFVRERYHEALNEAEQSAFALVDPQATRDLAVVVTDAVTAVAVVVERFGPIMMHLRDNPAERRSSGLARSILFERYRRVVLAAADQITHPDSELAVAVTFRVVFETLAFSVHDPLSVPLPLRHTPDQHRAELASMVLAYLTTTPPTRGTP
ncbi:TetR/AcrR family transcriptional regulator [uncultured Friedmanniella sp.]|uniref:TetR/AcrR family transcriptional regulator n=1 Tax=uncultured Friedmanniella sp. TaxID=335381 RepID=UPI0035CB4A68